MALQDSISDVFKTKFANTVYELTQQTKARLRGIVDMEPLDAEDVMFDRVGSVEVQDINERFAEIIPADILWDRRRCTAARVGVPLFTDKWDAQRMLADPNSILARRAAEALERHFDRVVVSAATAAVYTGRNGTTSVSAATDGVQTVDATAGLTYAKLLEIEANFQKNEVGTEIPIRKFLLISEQEHTALMQEGTLISGDFSRQYVVDKGQMVRALDFELIVYGSNMPIPMLGVSAGTRTCLALAASAIKVGLSRSWNIDVQPRNDRWDTTQILASGIIGAVRMDALKIQKVSTTAT